MISCRRLVPFSFYGISLISFTNFYPRSILRSSKSEKDRVNLKLQKTISNLISNVISSLCQQVVQYERSIDIFGLLCINIDDDIDISVKLNEKFIKKEIIASNSNMDYSKLIETIQKNDSTKALEEVTRGIELEQSNEEMDADNKENDCPLLIDESEKSSSTQQRRPRKPQHTFRHIIVDESPNSKDAKKAKTASSISDNELKIDTQFEFKSNNSINKTNKTHTKIIRSDSMSKSNETDESDEKLCVKSMGSIIKISPSSSVLHVDNSCGKIDNVHAISKANQLYKCTICDRQFKRKFCLTRHKRVHQNYKSYLCNVCGLGFDLVNQLKRHLRNVHACSRENLRRSCRNSSQKSEPILKSPSDQFCPIECAWQLPKNASQLSLLPVKQMSATTNAPDCLSTKPVCFNQFSFPPGLIVGNSSRKPSPSAFSQTFTTPTSVATQYQVRQMFNSIMSATDTSMPYNNTLYYMQNYAQILPTAASTLYHHSVTNGNTPKSMPILSSAPATMNPMTLTNSCSQRLPINRFPQGLFTSPSLKSVPLPLNNNWNSTTRTPDSNQLDRLKQSTSPIKANVQVAKTSD